MTVIQTLLITVIVGIAAMHKNVSFLSLYLIIYNLQYIYYPEKIAIGGGISSQNIFIECIKKNVEKHAASLKYKIAKPEVVRCEFMNNSNLIGALYNFITNTEKQ
jgi:predicted NBD/HSP70 family sugar kinase